MNWSLLRLTSDVERPIFERSSWPFASVVNARGSGSEDCFCYTAPQCAARTIASRRADTFPESSLQRFSAFTAKSVRHHVVDSGARLAVVKTLAPLDPLCGLTALTRTSVERTDGSYVMAGVNSDSVQVGHAQTNDLARRQADGPSHRSGVSWLQLLDVERPRTRRPHSRVRIMSPRARDGRVMRRILIDSRDLDRLIERWKEIDNSEANPT